MAQYTNEWGNTYPNEFGNPDRPPNEWGNDYNQNPNEFGNPDRPPNEWGNSYPYEFGDPARSEGNPVLLGTGIGTNYVTTEKVTDYRPHDVGTGGVGKEHHAAGTLGGMLRRSGSSSSSEDDGQGGRRKKGIKEKIKEKLPGGGGVERQHHEKKGFMEKIKEKLPGHH